jgi:hypothetical protein
MRGKYSPTVSRAYMKDQKWWDNYTGRNDPDRTDWIQYDPEGFDSYGYDKNDIDRAGNHENDYMHNDGDYNRDEDFNNAYDDASDNWGFDGTKPTKYEEIK